MSGSTVDFGHASLVVRPRRGRFSWRFNLRTVVVVALILVATLVAALLALGLGTIRLGPGEVVDALLGNSTDAMRTMVVDWRLPRILLAVMFGAALGVGGAIFQSLTRNPLGSPDIIGFDAGAYTGAVATIIVTQTLNFVIPGALVGGIVIALLVYLLAYRRGMQGFRLIVVGIAITAVLGSLNTYLILKADLWAAQMAAIWGAGSLNGLDWSDARQAAVALGVVAIPLSWFGRRLAMLELGDDAARALGLRVEVDRLALVILGVAASAVVTAIAGPIAFVALCAPQIASRLTRAPGVQIIPAAALGAFLLLICDIAAANLFAPTILPVGLVTVVLGGCYLVWLIVRQARRELR